MNLNDTFHYISTIITTASSKGNDYGTGFYYNRLAPTDTEGPQWRTVDGIYLVTNRHVLIPRSETKEHSPHRISFQLRKISEDGGLTWEIISLDRNAIEQFARFHRDKSIDVALLDVSDLMMKYLATEQYTTFYGLSSENFAGRNNIEVEVATDVLIVGYPRMYYDKVNLYPIVKSGIVASRWGSGVQGQPYFLIDAKLFPGSSGSVVVSKPVNMVVKDSKVLHSAEKQFAFLGIYSGEPEYTTPIELDDLTIIKKSGFNLGIVWYAELVEESLIMVFLFLIASRSTDSGTGSRSPRRCRQVRPRSRSTLGTLM